MNQLSSTGLLLVNNVDAISKFISQIFDDCKIENISKPLPHVLICISDGCRLLLINKKDCSPQQLQHMQNFAMNNVSITTNLNIDDILKCSIQAGGRMIENKSDSSYCVFEGPEGIIFFIASINDQKHFVQDIIMSSVAVDSSSNTSSITAEASVLTTVKSSKITSVPRTIPSLDVQIFTNGKFVTMEPNSRDPVPFDTGYFKGHAMLVVRTAPIEPRFASFFDGRRRRFEVQVQGKFLRPPEGEVYIGAEGSAKMQLGLVTRSISNAACNLASTMAPSLHSSLGDDNTNPLYQLPHMVSPLFPTPDKIIATPPNQIPPKLGEPFVEDPEYRKQRLQWMSVADAKVDLETTYSFSVNTSNIDLTAWCIMNIPLVRPMDLRTFFGDTSIALVGYEIPKSIAQSHPNIHPKKHLNYIFSIKLSHVEQTNDDLALTAAAETSGGSAERQDTGAEQADAGDDDDPDADAEDEMIDGIDNEGEDQEFIGADFAYSVNGDDNADIQSSVHKPRFKSNKVDRGGNTVGSWFKRRIDDMTPDALDVPETTELCQVDYDMEGLGDLRYCPMSINIIDRGIMKSGRRRTIYLLPWPPLPSDATSTSTGYNKNTNPVSCRFRSYNELIKMGLLMVPIPRIYKNRKYSSDEKKRRQILESYKEYKKNKENCQNGGLNNLIDVNTTFEYNMNMINQLDTSFLDTHHEPLLTTKKFDPKASLITQTGGGKLQNESQTPKWQGGACMAVSNRHWTEYIFKMNKMGINISLSSESLRISYSIPAKSIFCIRPMDKEETPLLFVTGFSFFQIETFSRIYYIMVREKWLTSWLQTLNSLFGNTIVKLTSSTMNDNNGDNNNIIYRFPEAAEASYYVARPTSWRLDKRRIFNFRRIIFSSQCIPSKYINLTPNQLIEDILSAAFSLSAAEAKRSADATQWIHFLDSISVLQNLDFSGLNDNQKLAFLLNLYHLMIVHASLVMGPPPSWVNWQGFFNTSYLLSFDVVSILEVEFNLLRSSMSRPSSLQTKVTVPNTLFPGMAFSHRDFRLNFCINNSSRSFPCSVPIYKPNQIDKQMDEYTSLMLTEFVRVDHRNASISIPKICSFYQSDFSSRRLPNPTLMDIVRMLLPYLKNDQRQWIMKLVSEGGNVNVRFLSFDFRCNQLSLQR